MSGGIDKLASESHRLGLPDGSGARDLDPRELRALVGELARRGDLWGDHVRHDPNERTFYRLHWDPHLELWMIGWMPGHDTGFHDHDRCAGAVAVASGCVCEQRLRVGTSSVGRIYGAGEVFDFAATEIHRVTHSGSAPTVTLHAYSPPLQGVGAYVIDAAGKLERHSLGPGEPLRPLS